jgi:hypothetical protein
MKQGKGKFWRIILMLSTAAVLFILCGIFLVQRIPVLIALYTFRNDTYLQEVPVHKNLNSLVASATIYTFENLQLYTPWKNVARVHQTPDGSMLAISEQFTTSTTQGTSLILQREPGFHDKFISSSADQKFFGPTITSNYAMFAASLNTKPSDLKLFSSPSKSIPSSLFLWMKKTLTFTGRDVQIKEFTTNHGLKGFEFFQTATTTFATFFTSDDKEYSLSSGGMSQLQFDSVLQSIQEVSTTSKIKSR